MHPISCVSHSSDGTSKVGSASAVTISLSVLVFFFLVLCYWCCSVGIQNTWQMRVSHCCVFYSQWRTLSAMMAVQRDLTSCLRDCSRPCRRRTRRPNKNNWKDRLKEGHFSGMDQLQFSLHACTDNKHS